jgi:hypothetical protein
MGIAINNKEIIIKHIEGLPPELIQEVIDFIEFLKIKRMDKTGIDYSLLLFQQKILGQIWDSESEDLYEL